MAVEAKDNPSFLSSPNSGPPLSQQYSQPSHQEQLSALAGTLRDGVIFRCKPRVAVQNYSQLTSLHH